MFRIGERVECIKSANITDIKSSIEYNCELPVKGKIYTVKKYYSQLGIKGITINELSSGIVTYRVDAFRSVDEYPNALEEILSNFKEVTEKSDIKIKQPVLN